MLLHRLSVKKYNPATGRMYMDYSPWHHDKDYVESFVSVMARDAGGRCVSVDSIPLRAKGYIAKCTQPASVAQAEKPEAVPMEDLSVDFASLLAGIV